MSSSETAYRPMLTVSPTKTVWLGGRYSRLMSASAGTAQQIPNKAMLFEPGSVEDLARALVDFLSDSSEEVCSGVSTIEAMTEATEGVYATALSRRS